MEGADRPLHFRSAHAAARFRHDRRSHLEVGRAAKVSWSGGPLFFSCACPGCSKLEETPKVFKCCSRCKIARYCSPDCWKRAWGVCHKVECGPSVPDPRLATRLPQAWRRRRVPGGHGPFHGGLEHCGCHPRHVWYGDVIAYRTGRVFLRHFTHFTKQFGSVDAPIHAYMWTRLGPWESWGDQRSAPNAQRPTRPGARTRYAQGASSEARPGVTPPEPVRNHLRSIPYEMRLLATWYI